MEAEAYYRVGMLLRGEELIVERDRCIVVREGIVESISSSSTCPREVLGGPGLVATPQPALGHVHSGDHAFPEYGVESRLKDLVAPPDGVKHKLLASTPKSKLVESILEYYRLAWRLGVGLLVDFREGGGEGCLAAKEALSKAPPGLHAIILGRPGPGFPQGCDGLGLSSPLDLPREELVELASRLRPSMAHVAESPEARLSGDLEAALEAGLDAIVHGTFLSPGDLESLVEAGMGLVACPRSNLWHGLGAPPLWWAYRLGVKLALGSDNAAWMPPDPWEEAATAVLLARAQGGPLGEDLALWILRALYTMAYELVGEKPRIIEEGRPARFLIFNVEGWGVERSASKYYALVKRLGAGNLVARVDDGEVSFL